MNLKSGIHSLLLGTVLLGAGAASASDWDAYRGRTTERRDDRRDDRWDDRRDERRDDRRDEGRPAVVSVHVHGPACHHAPAPAPRPDGRYELRTTQRWVSGYEDRVWVPEECRTKQNHHSRKTVCRGGYYDTRFVEGHYEPMEEWVWVPNPYRGRDYERRGPAIQVTARF